MSKLRGLGRGLDALLGEDKDAKEGSGDSNLRMMSVHNLKPGKYQPRQRMDDQGLDELADSIRQHGVLQPILVRTLTSGQHEIIAGERRWRAAKSVGLQEVPVLIREMEDQATLAVALIENLQREDLNVLEEALGIQRLIQEFGLTHDQAAKVLGKSRSAVSNLLRMLELSESVRSLLMDGVIDMGHARAVLPLGAEDQREVVLEIIDKRWSVREAENRVKQILKQKLGEVPAPKSKKSTGDKHKIETRLSHQLGTEVEFKARQGKGTLTIRFSNMNQLEEILDKLDAGLQSADGD